MPRITTHPFEALIHHAAEIIAARLSGRISQARPAASNQTTRAPGGMSANERRSKAMRGRKLDMSCRVEGCKNRSGGPGRGYMCPQHQKLGKKAQQAARDAWKAKNA